MFVKKVEAVICNPLVPETCEGVDSTTEGPSMIAAYLAKFLTVLLSVAGIALLFMILWAALEWITAGGDSEKVKAAQKRLTSAIIGFVLVATAAVILDVIGGFLGLQFLRTLDIPWPTL